MRVVLFGYYGFGNAGDEAVLAGLLHGLRLYGPPGVEYVALSGNPNQTEAVHGVQARPRNHWRTLVRETSDADVWVFGGGSLLQDVTGPFTLPYYLGVMGLLSLRRRKFALHAQGVGPITRSLSRLATGPVVSRAARISVRDVQSADTLVQLGVSKQQIDVGADLAFLLPTPKPALAQEGGSELVGLAVREWAGKEEWLPQLVAGTQRFLAETEAQVVVVPMDHGTDLSIAQRIVDQLPGRALLAKGTATYDEKMQLLASCSAVLAMRLHAGVLAALASVPTVFIAYDPKVHAMAKQLDAPVLDVDSLTEKRLYTMLTGVWGERTARAEHLAIRVDGLRRQAEQDMQGLVLELFDQRVPTGELSRT